MILVMTAPLHNADTSLDDRWLCVIRGCAQRLRCEASGAGGGFASGTGGADAQIDAQLDAQIELEILIKEWPSVVVELHTTTTLHGGRVGIIGYAMVALQYEDTLSVVT